MVRIFIILLFMGSTAAAVARDILVWEDCVREAKDNHPGLISAKESLQEVKADRAAVISNLLPQISSSASQETSRTGPSKTRPDTYAYSVSGEQLVFDGFKIPYDIISATKDIRAQQYSYNVTSSNVRLNLRTAFVQLLKEQRLLEITGGIEQRRNQNVELVKLRYEAGREHKGALLTAQANLAQAEFEVAQARRNISVKQRQLLKELGREKFSPVEVKGAFSVDHLLYKERPDFDKLAQNTPFLRDLVEQKEAARFDLKSAKADLFPKVYVTGSLGKTGPEWPPVNDKWAVGGRVSFPIFEGGSRIADISKARAAFNQAQADERSGKDSVLLTLEETWAQLQDAVDTVSVKQKFLTAAEERAKIAQAQYSSGLVSFDDWTIIEDDLVDVKKSFLDAQADYLVKEATWVQAKGGTLDE
ncbi:MAG: TolC family protein [Candidatus Omnitrophota bacterium]|nr:MAG: TolC family protein [Candidatus Omnitrophota bacterium]